MRKSTLFISAVLTTFVMAMLAGVASAYQNLVSPEQVTFQQAQPQVQEVQAVSNEIQAVEQLPVAPQPVTVNLTPEEAADLASKVLGRDDLYSIEVTDFEGETVYLVTFSSGDLVYISLDGQIRSIGKVEVETVIVNSGNGGGGGRTSNNRQSSGRHDDHEEHEDDD